MSSDTFSILMMSVLTLGFIVYMVTRQKELFTHSDSSEGLAWALDNVRFIFGFVSFIFMSWLTISGGMSFLSKYDLPIVASIISTVVVIAGGVLFPYAVVINIIYAERSISQKGLPAKKKIIVALVYAVLLVLEFANVELGSNSILSNLEKTKIEKNVKVDKKTKFTMKNKEYLTKKLQKQLSAIERAIDTIHTSPVRETKRIKSLRQQIRRCNHKSGCPNTQKILKNVIERQRIEQLSKLRAEENRLTSKIEKIIASYEDTSRYIDNGAKEKVKEIKSEIHGHKQTIFYGAIIWLLSMLFISYGAENLRTPREEEEIQEESNLRIGKEDINAQMIREAMEKIAENREINLEYSKIHDDNLVLNFSRDEVRRVVLAIAKDKEIIFQMGNAKLMRYVNEYRGAGSSFRMWLAAQAWNVGSIDNAVYAA